MNGVLQKAFRIGTSWGWAGLSSAKTEIWLCYEVSKLGLTNISGEKVYHLLSLYWWKFITVTNIIHCNEYCSLIWEFLTEVKIHYVNGYFYISDKNWSLRWKLLTDLEIHHWDENSLNLYKFIPLMKIHHSDIYSFH